MEQTAERVTLKGYKGHETLDGVSWTASIHLDGKKVGTVEQGGFGGCNAYYFPNRADEKTLNDLAHAWALEKGKDNFEVLDAYVGMLLDRIEEEKLVAKLRKRNPDAHTVVLLQSKPTKIGDEVFYDRESAFAIPPKFTLSQVVAHYKPDAFRVLWTIQTTER
jgi:hypothetical protein